MLTWLDTLKKRERYFCNPGERVEKDYKVHYDKNGVRSLDVDGQRNTYDEIQSFKDSVDINVIIKRYQNGDLTALSRNSPAYLDCTEFPSSYAEWFERGEAAKRYFNSLDPDVRALYNNSFEQFLSAEVKEPKIEEAINKIKEEKKEETVNES